MSKDFPEKLTEKLKTIRDRAGMMPNEFAPHVKAKDGDAIESYESGRGDIPISVLFAYARYASIPVENLIDDERDLLFEQLGGKQ